MTLSLVESVRELLVRGDQQAGLGAFTAVDNAAALAAAAALDRMPADRRGPLYGTVLAVKDNIDVAGFSTTAGTAALCGRVPAADAPVVRSLREAGAVVLGKTNMHELAYGVTSDNGYFGRVAHPLDTVRTPGGSSGGTAVAVAAGLATAGLGTETGCSVRVPAALCGLIGFRPTHGRYSLNGVVPVSTTRDTIGVITSSVEQAAALDAVIAGHAETTAASGMRLGAPRSLFCQGVPSDLLDQFDQRLAELARAGFTLVAADPPQECVGLAAACGMSIALYETPRSIDAYLAEHRWPLRFPDIVADIASPDVASLLRPLVDGGVPPDAYRKAMEYERVRLAELMDGYMTRHRLDALVMPTAPITAPVALGGDRILVDGQDVSAFPVFTRNADISSVLGWPAVSVPAFRDSAGLPFGIDLQARPGHDGPLLALARRCEDAWRGAWRSAVEGDPGDA
ncbi:MAG TPA: amidase family protein [Candidatus Limnocylindrales bacterium]|nr:amidase family protein [Candidatus Limnocylindrales bacterium]